MPRAPLAPRVGRLFVVRHAQSGFNADRVLQGPRLDGELSPVGRDQAQALGRVLADVRLHDIYSSPLRRARETAEAVIDRQRDTLALQIVPELYEMDYGDYSGRPLAEIQGDLEQVFDAWRLGFIDQAFPGGESALLAQHRVRPFAQRLRAHAVDHDLLVVAHGRINRVLLATLLGRGLDTLDETRQPNAGISEVDVGRERATLVRFDDTGHLDLAADSFS